MCPLPGIFIFFSLFVLFPWGPVLSSAGGCARAQLSAAALVPNELFSLNDLDEFERDRRWWLRHVRINYPISTRATNQNKLRSVERTSLTPKLRSVLSSLQWNHNPYRYPENCDFSLRSGPVLSSALLAERSEKSQFSGSLFGLWFHRGELKTERILGVKEMRSTERSLFWLDSFLEMRTVSLTVRSEIS